MKTRDDDNTAQNTTQDSSNRWRTANVGRSAQTQTQTVVPVKRPAPLSSEAQTPLTLTLPPPPAPPIVGSRPKLVQRNHIPKTESQTNTPVWLTAALIGLGGGSILAILCLIFWLLLA